MIKVGKGKGANDKSGARGKGLMITVGQGVRV